MKMFYDKKASQLFFTISDQFTDGVTKSLFTSKIKALFLMKQTSDKDLTTFMITAQDVEAVYEEVNEVTV